MKIKKNIFTILITSLLVLSCSNTVDGFKLKKKSSSGEEFLIEKKDPLILPPDFSKLPKPNEELQEIDEDINFEAVFKNDNSKTKDKDKLDNTPDSKIKNSILKKIQKQ